MWWGGFSELNNSKSIEDLNASLNPHVVGRFFRGRNVCEIQQTVVS